MRLARPFAALWAFESQPTPSPLWLHPLRARSALRAQRQAFGQHQPPQCKAFGRFPSTGFISGHRARSQTVRGTVWCAGRSRPGRASTRQDGLNSEARHRHGRTHEPPSATPDGECLRLWGVFTADVFKTFSAPLRCAGGPVRAHPTISSSGCSDDLPVS